MAVSAMALRCGYEHTGTSIKLELDFAKRVNFAMMGIESAKPD